MSVRKCPGCNAAAIPTTELVLSDVRCPACGRVVGPYGIVRALFLLVVIVVTGLSTYVVFARYGMYAALFWFSVPISAVGLLKAQFAPLAVRSEDYAK